VRRRAKRDHLDKESPVAFWSPFRPTDGRIRDLRMEMINDTSRFLTWALAQDRGLPRIPRKRVDAGGFSEMLKVPGVKKLMWRWWDRTLDKAWPERWS
jgi:hypothetical protein